MLVRTRSHGFELKDFFVDVFDAHLILTNRSLSQMAFADVELNHNKGRARYKEDPTSEEGPNFRLEYALASRNGASCRIAILATEGPQNNPLLGTMGTLRDSAWQDMQPAPHQNNSASILAAALTLGTYVFTSVPH